MQDLYAILGVGQDSSNAAIKAAYRELAKQSHPDLHIGDGAAEDRSKEINHAYAILGDPEARAAYDEKCALAAARVRKVAFMNNAAIAAGIAFFAIVAATATLMVTRMHSSQPHFASEPVHPAAASRIATIGVPETAAAHSGIAVSRIPEPGSATGEQPAAAADLKEEAPVKEAELTARVPVTQPETGAASATEAAKQAEPVTAAEPAGHPAVPQTHEPAAAAEAEEVRTAPAAKAATQEPAAAKAAGMGQAGPEQTAPEQPATPAVIASIQEMAPAGAAGSPESGPEHNTGNSTENVPAVAPAAEAAGPEPLDVHRERAADGKASEPARAFQVTGFAPPRLRQESGFGWIASRKAIALRWRSADGPWGEIADSTR